MLFPIISERSLTFKVKVKRGLLYVDHEIMLLEVQRYVLEILQVG